MIYVLLAVKEEFVVNRVKLELEPSADISEASLQHAMDKLIEYNLSQKKSANFSYRVLLCASQDMGVAVILARWVGAGIEISPTYKEDEWSLEEHQYFDDSREQRTVAVHSRGA